MRTKFWINLTTEDISKLSRNTIIIVPFSAIEQHGPHLPLGTDKIILDKDFYVPSLTFQKFRQSI